MRLWLWVGLLAGVLAFQPLAEACGDKLLALSRAVRFQRAYAAVKPANILIYAARTTGTSTVKEPRLHATLKQAGHKLRTAQGDAEFQQALRSGQFDLVLVDAPDAAAVKPQVNGSPSQPLVLPVFNKPNKRELAVAEKEYGFYLLGPDRPIECLVAIDLAMKSRGRNGRSS